MDTNSYYDFAENDYQFLKAAYEDGDARGNLVCAISQNICEKYLKDIVDKYVRPKTEEEERMKQSALRTHSLIKLENTIEKMLNLKIADPVKDIIEQADGYYFSSRYPGDESIEASERDMRKCIEAVKKTREIHPLIVSFLQERSQEEKSSDDFPQHSDGDGLPCL